MNAGINRCCHLSFEVIDFFPPPSLVLIADKCTEYEILDLFVCITEVWVWWSGSKMVYVNIAILHLKPCALVSPNSSFNWAEIFISHLANLGILIMSFVSRSFYPNSCYNKIVAIFYISLSEWPEPWDYNERRKKRKPSGVGVVFWRLYSTMVFYLPST